LRDLTDQLLDADESAPHRGKPSTDQNVQGVPAEHIAVEAHLRTELAQLTMVGGVKDRTRQPKDRRRIHFHILSQQSRMWALRHSCCDSLPVEKAAILLLQGSW
jgi:hypothetical protein